VALTHLVDTSVLTRLRTASIREAIESRAERGELARAGINDLEIGYSARSALE
jgi:predicted nucleic acid-binding protein